MGVREDRLRAENEAMKKFRSQVVRWQTVGPNQTLDRYHFDYTLKSIVGFHSNGAPQYYTGFKVEVHFKPDYPRSSPEVRLISTPWPFHPNVWRDGRFCLEGTQHWIPGIGVPLDAICLMVGEIIAFQEVNLNSPANADTILHSWIRAYLYFENGSSTKVTNPVDPAPIRLPDTEDSIRWGESSSPKKPRIHFG